MSSPAAVSTGTSHRRVIGSSLLRGLDPRIPANAAVLVAWLIAAIATGIRQRSGGADPVPAVGAAIGAGFSALLTWAVVREIDPDGRVDAWIAMVAACALGALVASSLMPLICELIGARVLLRSTGSRATVVDWFVFPVAAGLAGRVAGGDVAAVGMAIAVFLDARIDRPVPAVQIVSAGVAVAAAFVVAGLSGTLLPHITTMDAADIATVAVAVAGAGLILPFAVPAPAARDDKDRGVLSAARATAMVRLVAATSALSVVAAGDAAHLVWPLAVALAAVALVRAAATVRHR